jgi:hypothetical protein
MQLMGAYELVALGGSAFIPLFTGAFCALLFHPSRPSVSLAPLPFLADRLSLVFTPAPY